MEAAMMPNDVYGCDLDERMLEQEAVWRDRVLPELEWDESEEWLVVDQLLGGSRTRTVEHA